MQVRPASLALFLLFCATSVVAADDDQQRGLRGEGRRLPGPQGQGQGNQGPQGQGAQATVDDVAAPDDGSAGAGTAGADDEPPPSHPQRELSGRVIISRKSEKKLKAQGKTPAQAAAARAKGLNKIKANGKIVFESSGDDGDFQVIEVGKGKEIAFAKRFMDEDAEGLFSYAEPDYIEYPDLLPNEAGSAPYSNQYHHTLMKSAQAWDLTTGDPAVTVAICDTGLQLDHPDLAANRKPGYHATTQCWEGDTTCTANLTPVHQHGTNCAGCAAAIGNNGQGLTGVGWRFFHRPGRVSDVSSGSSNSAVLADCARKMCEKPDVKVVSVSYSGVEAQSRRDAATYCKTQGALMVNAAGNDGRDLSQFGEADADDLIVVGASTATDTKSGFSAYGRFIDVWAPGSSVWTTTTNSGYTAVSGTSFSCPLTAGLIALIWSKNPELTPNEVEYILKRSTDNVGIQTLWNSPYGRINSFNAVSAAGSGTPFPTQSPTTPPPTSSPTACENHMCDDGKVCTIDTCDGLSGMKRVCKHDYVGNCCGNKICEPGAGETIHNCVDCYTGPSYTRQRKCNAEGVTCYVQAGNMFDVVAKNKAVSITSMKIHFYGGSVAEVWTRPGTHVGNEWSSAGWKKIAEHDFTGTGAYSTVTIPESSFTQTVEIPALARQAFYVTLRSGGNVLYQTSATPSTNNVVSEDDHLIIYEGPAKVYNFGGQTGPRCWNGQMVYMTGAAATTPSPTPKLTPGPTNNPTTPIPSKSPITPQPTTPPTPPPTTQPTLKPTLSPTKSPSVHPTTSPTLSFSPTVYVPEIVELVAPPTNSATVLQAAYFEVQGGTAAVKITDLAITSYYTTHLQVYSKVGVATPYEATPCAWKLVAETAPGWNGGSWKRNIYPQWNSNGFEPVVLAPNSKVSFYVTNMGSSNGILGKSGMGKYVAWQSLPPESPAGAVVLTTGRNGYSNSPFKPYPDYYSGYAIWGGVKLETIQPGTDLDTPTMSPTALYAPGSLESPMTGSDQQFKGLMFDVENIGSNAIILSKFSVPFSSAGSCPVEVWMRSGSHQGSSGACDHWNNWCGAWTKLSDTTVTSTAPGVFTNTGTFNALIEAGTTAAFAIITGKDNILTTDGVAANVVENGELRINLATPIADYHGDNVQTIFAIDQPSKRVQAVATYDIANSKCAVLSKADWVVLNPANAASQQNVDEEEPEEPESVSYVPEEDEALE